MVKQMEKALEKPQLADRDKDSKLSGWEKQVQEIAEKAVGKKIESSKKGKETGEYKSDRGNKKIPFKEGVKKAGMCKGSMCKMGCKEDGCGSGLGKGDAPVSSSTAGTSKPRHSDDDEKHNQKVFADIMGDGDSDKAHRTYDKKVNKADLTAQIIMKYQQEKSNDNASPQFIDYSGGTPVEAKPYQTNGTIPFYTEKAPASKPISEKAKLFAVAKTGYDVDGSTMHMNIVDGGDTGGPYNLASIEDSMATLHKMGGDSGLLSEIAYLIEKIGNHQ